MSVDSASRAVVRTWSDQVDLTSLTSLISLVELVRPTLEQRVVFTVRPAWARKGQSLATSRLDITPVLVQGHDGGISGFQVGLEPDRRARARELPRPSARPGSARTRHARFKGLTPAVAPESVDPRGFGFAV